LEVVCAENTFNILFYLAVFEKVASKNNAIKTVIIAMKRKNGHCKGN
jgi:hypothetical protein